MHGRIYLIGFSVYVVCRDGAFDDEFIFDTKLCCESNNRIIVGKQVVI